MRYSYLTFGCHAFSAALCRMFAIFLLAFSIFNLASCHSNNGDIGPLYGQWMLDSYTIDGQEADIDVYNYNWRFQNNIIQITYLLPVQDYIIYTGTWSLSTDQLTLYFNHSSNANNPGGYTPPAELGLSYGITVMHVETLTNNSLILKYTDADGLTHKYTLRKLL